MERKKKIDELLHDAQVMNAECPFSPGDLVQAIPESPYRSSVIEGPCLVYKLKHEEEDRHLGIHYTDMIISYFDYTGIIRYKSVQSRHFIPDEA